MACIGFEPRFEAVNLPGVEEEFDPLLHDYIPALSKTTRLRISSINLNKAATNVAISESSSILIEKRNLRIIVKTYMNQGKCYIGWDGERLWRPIMTTQKGLCCWPANQDELKVGVLYEFTFIEPHPEDISYPHRWNDVLVTEDVTTLGVPGKNLFDTLMASTFNAVSAVFHPGSIQDGKYIKEDTICPSVGIFKGKGSQLKMYSKQNQYGNIRKRLVVTDKSMQYDFPITALAYKQSFDADEDVLVVLGLGRPWDSNGKFNPKRCYILVIGIITS